MTSEAVNEIINQMLNNLPAGCTDDTACNYDSEALNDDGSCDYPLDGCSCSSIDNDNDGICNEIDICPDNWDPYQHDRDQDGLPDACDDNDDDGDGLIDCWDYWYSDGISMSESDILAAIESEGCQDFALENNIFSPFSIGLLNSFPNPFNPSTLITFSLNVSQFIAITIYDTKGQKINDLVNGFYNAGNHEIQWIPNGLISSGLYIVVLKTKHSQLKHKILYLK